jgi:hypothetical protein
LSCPSTNSIAAPSSVPRAKPADYEDSRRATVMGADHGSTPPPGLLVVRYLRPVGVT